MKSLCRTHLSRTVSIKPDTPIEKGSDESIGFGTPPDYFLAETSALVLVTMARSMMKGDQFNIGDDLIRQALFIRSSICGLKITGTWLRCFILYPLHKASVSSAYWKCESS